MATPNLFSIATKELSQDAFVTWLLQWADDSYSKENTELCNCGKDFVNFLLGKANIDSEVKVSKVECGRQWASIDIWADINEEYFIVIEDKINASEHDNQLERYKKFVNDCYEKSRKITCIYLKTGLESLDSIKEVGEKGWIYIGRNDFLDFLSAHEIQNDIYTDYCKNLLQMKQISESFTEYENLNLWDATKGLYCHIQEELDKKGEWSHWDYVPNASGGFLGLWHHFIPCAENEGREFYLQIENYCNDKVNLFVKICGEWRRDVDYLYEVLHFLIKISPKYNLKISKPSRYKVGEYTSVAIIEDVFVETEGKKLDLQNLMEKIFRSEELINELAENF